MNRRKLCMIVRMPSLSKESGKQDETPDPNGTGNSISGGKTG